MINSGVGGLPDLIASLPSTLVTVHRDFVYWCPSAELALVMTIVLKLLFFC